MIEPDAVDFAGGHRTFTCRLTFWIILIRRATPMSSRSFLSSAMLLAP